MSEYIERTQGAEPEKKPAFQTLKRILRETRPIRGWILLCACVNLVSVALILIGPEMLGSLTNVIYAFRAEGAPIDMPSFIRSCAVRCT